MLDFILINMKNGIAHKLNCEFVDKIKNDVKFKNKIKEIIEEYGNKNIRTYNIDTYKIPTTDAAKSTTNGTTGFAFRTAESFLKGLEKKDEKIDVSQYQEGQKVYHKKFGEGIINKLEPEGDDFKVDISFEKSGNKRLMAKFAGLQIID